MVVVAHLQEAIKPVDLKDCTHLNPYIPMPLSESKVVHTIQQ
jgi:hypothetical protein